MRLVNVIKVALTILVAISAVAAYGQLSADTHYVGGTASVVDEKGSMRMSNDLSNVGHLGGRGRRCSWFKGDACRLCLARRHSFGG
jgi:hypothetical protein